MDSKKPISIAGYVRVSGLKQVKLGSSLPEQRKAIKAYARAHGYRIFQIYADKGISGAKADRPALMRMKADAKKDLFQKVVFTYLDRFGRSATDTLMNYTYFENLGISLHSIREGLDTDTFWGRFIRTILAGAAEMERERIRERLIMGLLYRLEKGLPVGPPPFGYSWNREERKLEGHPDQKPIYERIVDDYLVRKKSMSYIAAALNLSGVKSRQGKKWTVTAIMQLLRNPAYKGCLSYNFQGKRYDLACPPLIEPDRWNEIQKRMEERRIPRPAYISDNDPYLLRKLLQCEECQHTIYPYSIKSKGKVLRYYICYLGHMNPALKMIANTEKKCLLPIIRAEEIEGKVLNDIRAYLLKSEEMIPTLIRLDVNMIEELEGKIRRGRIKLGFLESGRDEIWGLFNENAIGKEELINRDNALREPLAGLRKQLGAWEEELSLIRSRQKRLEEVANSETRRNELDLKIEDAFRRMTVSQLRGFLKAAFSAERLKVRILRRRDLPEEEQGTSAEAMDELVVDPHRRGKNRYRWKVDGTQGLDIRTATQYLKLFIESGLSRVFFC